MIIRDLKVPDLPMPVMSRLTMGRLTVGDICAMAEGDLDKNGKAKGPWLQNAIVQVGTHRVTYIIWDIVFTTILLRYKKQTDLLM